MISRVCRSTSRSMVQYNVRMSSVITPTTDSPAAKKRPVLKKYKDVIDNREAAKALAPEDKREIGFYKAQRFRELTRRSSKAKSFTDYAVGDIEPLPDNPAELAALTGMPDIHQHRTVEIRNRFSTTMQSGNAFQHQWQITWKRSETWTNPLTGYTSGADPMASVRLYFDTVEEAIQYAERYNWKYVVKTPVSEDNKEPGWRNYGQNFLPAKVAASPIRRKRSHFSISTYGSSHFSMPLKYHGDGEVNQHGGE